MLIIFKFSHSVLWECPIFSNRLKHLVLPILVPYIIIIIYCSYGLHFCSTAIAIGFLIVATNLICIA